MSACTVVCVAGRDVALLTPTNPVLRSRSEVRIESVAKSTSPVPDPCDRRRAFVLVEILEYANRAECALFVAPMICAI
jgi:hypothetical protein